jgi:hypothetical protein
MLSLSQLKYSKQDHLQRLLLDLSPTESYKVLHSEQVTLLGKTLFVQCMVPCISHWPKPLARRVTTFH